MASLAEANRAPFDIPEAESELVAGFHVEYSGFRWAMVMLSEYGMMLLVAFLMCIFFFEGWNTPLPNIGSVELATWTSGVPETISGHLWGAFWMISKGIANGSHADLDPLDLPKIKARSIDEFKLEISNAGIYYLSHVMCNCIDFDDLKVYP